MGAVPKVCCVNWGICDLGGVAGGAGGVAGAYNVGGGDSVQIRFCQQNSYVAVW